MSESTCSRARRRRAPGAPVIPLVNCPDCGRKIKLYVSGTRDHDGWVFYRCLKHGETCNFWHWEREYVVYLLDNNVLRGDAAVDALGWAEDRREALEAALGNRRLAEECGTGACTSSLAREVGDMKQKNVDAIVLLLKMVVALLAMLLTMVCVLCVLVKK